MNDSSPADVAREGSGGSDWEEILEGEQERRRVTDLGRILPQHQAHRGRVFTARLRQDERADSPYERTAIGGIETFTPRYCLQAANGRRVSINRDDLAFWLEAYFEPTQLHRTKNGQPSLRLLPMRERKASQKVMVESIRGIIPNCFPTGDWIISCTDGNLIHVPRNHASVAIEALSFTADDDDRIRATFPHRNQRGVQRILPTEENQK